MEDHPDVVVSGSYIEVCDSKLKTTYIRKYHLDDQSIRKHLFRYSPFAHPATIWKAAVLKKANEIKNKLKKYSVELDERDEYTPGWKFNEYELKGIPLRIEIGPKDLEKNQVVLVRRDNGEKKAVSIENLDVKVGEMLLDIQNFQDIKI